MKKFSKLSIYAVIVSFAVISYSCSKSDDGGGDSSEYFHYGDHSYMVVKQAKNWADAAADAKAKGGYLVEIGSQAEQDAVYKGIKDAGVSATYTTVNDGGGIAYVWIGATDRESEGKWKWNGANTAGGGTAFWNGTGASGSVVSGSYACWGGKSKGSFNEPDDFTDPQYAPKGQDAAAIGLAKWPAGIDFELGKAGEWNDIAETNKIYYVIEFDSVK